jgi:hypothetical protein
VSGRFLTRLSLAIATAVLLGLPTRPAAQQPPPGPVPGGPPQTAGQRYKNLQILEDIPADQLMQTMQYVAASLGVQCNHCHVQGQNDSDDKETKRLARQMMRMVNTINDTHFEGRAVLSCASCHNGRNRPVRTPPLALEMTADQAARARANAPQGRRGRGGPAEGRGGAGGQGRGGAAPAQPERPAETLDQVIEKFTQALGGRAAVEAAKTRVMTGTVTARDLQSTAVTIQEKNTGEYRIDLATQPNPTVRVFDGKVAWTTGGGFGGRGGGGGRGGDPNAPRDLQGMQMQQALRLADFGLPLRINDRYTSLNVSRYADVDGKPAIVLTGRPYADVIEQLYFDRASGLLLRRQVATRTGLGELGEQIEYSDYRDVSGVRVPFSVRHATWNSVANYKMTDVKINAPVADSAFTKPAAAQGQ